MHYTSFKMVQLTVEQRVFIVQHLFKTESFEQVRHLFRERFPDREPPTTMTIWRNVKKYTTTGTSLNRNSVTSGRPRSGRSQENIDRVQDLLENNPRGITCRRNGLDKRFYGLFTHSWFSKNLL